VPSQAPVSRESWVSLGRSALKRYTLIILYPIKRNFTIKQATIEYNGQVYKTDPVKITVTAAVEQPRPNTSISVDDNLYLIADISRQILTLMSP
jgi:hypothetical protein